MRIAWLVALAACGSPTTGDDDQLVPDAAPDDPPPVVEPIAPLDVRALGVQGFALTYGNDTILTAPLFTRQSMFDVALNVPLPADIAAIDAGLAGIDLDKVRGVISGHAHYDHFMDVPHLLERAPNAIAYTNLTGRNMLAALAPDRPAGCTNTPAKPLPRERVVAMDDTLASKVDWTNCAAKKPPGVPLAGSWVNIPDSNVRVMAFCSMHPDQIGPFHFGEGSIDTEQCELPAGAAGWLEGLTIAFLIDFLDADGKPVHRVFYQDAPTDAPIGQVPATIISERAVDLALLCVGSNDAVANEPTAIIDNIHPRFALSGHWEDFFQDAGNAPTPIPFLDLDTYVQRAEAGLPGAPDAEFVVDGLPVASRHALAQSGMHSIVPALP
jgi:Metallo-beta-lactamase superfamily